MRELFNQCGLPYLWTKVGVDNSIPIGEIKQMLHDQYLQEWSSSLSSTSGKLRLYKLCKYEFKRELYLQLPMHLRCILSRLRLSYHSLLIETGRYRKPKPIPVDERKCIFCNMNAIEDEIHFLFYCEFYQKTKEYQDFVLEFGLNRAEVKSLPAEERWNRIWQSNDTKKLQTLAKILIQPLN